MFQFTQVQPNFSFSLLTAGVSQTFETCKAQVISATETCQSIACDTATKVHSNVGAFFIEAPKVVQNRFEEWRSTTGTGIANFVASRVVPAKNKYSAEQLVQLRTWATTSQFRAIERAGIEIEEVSFQTSDHATLNGVELKGQIEGEAANEKYIVFFMPNGALWEELLPKLKTIQQQSGANVVCYNYRGVGASTGTFSSEAPLINDGVEIINALIAKGMRTLPHGLSLGGGVATQVVAKLAQEGTVLHLCNERSFTSIPNVLIAHSPVLGFIASPILYWTGWMLDSETALGHLRGKVIVIFHPKDPVILPAAQFSRAIENAQKEGDEHASRRLQVEQIDTLELSEELGDGNAHCRSWFRAEEERYGELTKAIL